MTNKRFTLILLAVLTALMLAGCGRTGDSVLDSSSPEGIQTFGVTVDPSAQPSMGQVMPEVLQTPEADAVVQQGPTTIDGNDVQSGTNEANEAEEEEVPEETTATPSTKPSSSSNSGSNTTASPSISPSPSTSPTIAPPAPVSSAVADEAKAFVGGPLNALIESLGYPSRSDYEPVDVEDPEQGEYGTLYFTGFTVSTRRLDGVETVLSVTSTSTASEEPETSPNPTEETASSPSPSE